MVNGECQNFELMSISWWKTFKRLSNSALFFPGGKRCKVENDKLNGAFELTMRTARNMCNCVVFRSFQQVNVYLGKPMEIKRIIPILFHSPVLSIHVNFVDVYFMLTQNQNRCKYCKKKSPWMANCEIRSHKIYF